MPTYNIPVVYQTADAAAIVAALKWNFGLPESATNAEALAKLGDTSARNLIDIVSRHREHVAIEAAKAGLPPPIVVTTT
jgi:hypothetical protein